MPVILNSRDAAAGEAHLGGMEGDMLEHGHDQLLQFLDRVSVCSPALLDEVEDLQGVGEQLHHGLQEARSTRSGGLIVISYYRDTSYSKA